MAQIKVTGDGEIDAAYLYLRDLKAGEVTHSIQAPIPAGNIILDFDKAGQLVGIQVEGASHLLPAQLITQVQPDAASSHPR